MLLSLITISSSSSSSNNSSSISISIIFVIRRARAQLGALRTGHGPPRDVRLRPRSVLRALRHSERGYDIIENTIDNDSYRKYYDDYYYYYYTIDNNSNANINTSIRKGVNGVSTNGVAADCMFLTEGPFGYSS